MTELLRIYADNPQPKAVQKVIDILQSGGVIGFPTDGVYSFGCDLMQPKALEKLAGIKGKKPTDSEFSVIFADLSHLADYTKQVDTPTYKLLKKALPGPYTFILKANRAVPRLFQNKRKTIGIRIPDHKIPRFIAEELGHPLVASSVHDDDEILEYTTDPELIAEKYAKQVDLVIDGGMGSREASSVVDLTGKAPEVLREGSGTLDILS